MSPTEAAYFAGLLDGEGTILVWQRKDRLASRLSIRAVIVNTDYPVMEWLAEHVGGNVNDKPIWSWTVNGPNAVSVLKQALPYLVIKRAKAIAAVESQHLYLERHQLATITIS